MEKQRINFPERPAETPSNAPSAASAGQGMRVCLLGSGRVATHLALALQQADYALRSIYSRQLANARALTARLGLSEEVATDNATTLPEADFFLFSVKDDALPALIRQVTQRHGQSEALFVHTAGSVSLSIFDGLARHRAVLYPMQTFSKERALDFRRIPLFIEGSGEAESAAVERLARSLSERVTPLSSEGRKSLHLAAVFACNFANHCFTLGYRQMERAGLDPTLLLPLIDETVAKVHTLHPREAQTGPAVRDDRAVMDAQRAALDAFPTERAAYEILSQSIHQTSLPNDDQL